MRRGRVKVGESHTLERERGIRARAWRGKVGQAKRASLGEVEESMSR